MAVKIVFLRIWKLLSESYGYCIVVTSYIYWTNRMLFSIYSSDNLNLYYVCLVFMYLDYVKIFLIGITLLKWFRESVPHIMRRILGRFISSAMP